MTAVERFSIVCLSPQEWRADLPTNRQQVMRRAAARGHEVLFVETSYFTGRYLWRLVRNRGRRSLARRVFATERVAPRVRVRKALNLLPWGHKFRLAASANLALTAALLRLLARRLPQPVVLWIYDPCTASAVGACGEAFAVYDCVDDYVEQAGPDSRRRRLAAAGDGRAAGVCRLVFATTKPLYERHLRLNAKTHLVPNVGDFAHFRPAADRAFAEPALLDLDRPVLGFAGNLVASKVDAGLLEAVARAHPEWTILLVGPVRDDFRPAHERLQQLANVRWLGPVAYDRLPRYVAAFDVGLIPYVASAYTASCFPLKLFEYLAAGKPVVASGLPALAGMEPDVLLADGQRAFEAAVEHALGLLHDADRERRIALAAGNTWEQRARRLLDLVAGELAG